MLIATKKEHIKSGEIKEDGIITVLLKGASPAAVTVEDEERLTVFFQVDSKITCFIDVSKTKGGKLIITASPLDDVIFTKR